MIKRHITTGSKNHLLACLPVTAGGIFSINLHRSDADLHSLLCLRLSDICKEDEGLGIKGDPSNLC